MVNALLVLQGTAASPGIAIGPVCVLSSEQVKVHPRHGQRSSEGELARLHIAQQQAEKEIQAIYEHACTQVGEDESIIFRIHILMMQDEGFQEMIRKSIVEDHSSAEYAVWSATRKLYQTFSDMDDEYMRARKEDILDIGRRLLLCLNNLDERKILDAPVNYLTTPAVLCLAQAVPSQIIQTNHSQVLALVTQYGSITSHSALLARGMGKPAVVGLGAAFESLPARDGDVIVDGDAGQVIVNPTPAVLKEYTHRMSLQRSHRADLVAYKGLEAVSRDGVRVHLLANVNYEGDIQMALENDAEGIGLVRSEYMYATDRLPTEEEHLQQYKEMLAAFGKGDAFVVVRTVDLDSNAKRAYLKQENEVNPAMGCRSVRLCMRYRGLFRTQIRALLRASAYGRLGVLVPLINDAETFRQIRTWIGTLREELEQEGKPVGKLYIGAIIETPAAALQAHELARIADFFNIGTNDLTQFTLAVDRENHQMQALFNPAHPAVKRLIAYAVRCAKQAGIPVMVSGEAAADYSMLRFFLRLGVEYLSMAPAYILEMRKEIRRLTVHGTNGE